MKTRAWRHAVLMGKWGPFPVLRMQLAALKIQKVFRGYMVRMRRGNVGAMRAVKCGHHSLINPHPAQTRAEARVKLISKFLSLLSPEDMHILEDEIGLYAFRIWVVTRIQAWWRMLRQRRQYLLDKAYVYKIAATSLQYHISHYYERQIAQLGIIPRFRMQSAARVIQHAWRRFTSVQIFLYYRDLIRFRERGDPRMMLRAINPQEAAMFDAAAGIHVRFRLGGYAFPPNIYYKIYTHRTVTDVGAFAPRDYVANRRDATATKITLDEFMASAEQGQAPGPGWYRRVENNGWRPVSVKLLREYDEITFVSSRKTIVYPPLRSERAEVKKKRQHEKKRLWLRTLYEKGRALDEKAMLGGNGNGADDFESWAETETEDLLSWSRSLDFQAYSDQWTGLATTGASEMMLTQEFRTEDFFAEGIMGSVVEDEQEGGYDHTASQKAASFIRASAS